MKKLLLSIAMGIFILDMPQYLFSAYDAEPGAEQLLFMDIPIVTSAGFFGRKAETAPGNIVVITADTIARSPARNVSDILNYFAPGMNEFYHTDFNSCYSVRGIGVDSNAKTLVMFDGQQLNHRQHAGYSNELKAPLIGDIDQIEINNGPGAIVHGSGAISGFINILPKNGTKYPGLKVKTEAGIADNLGSVELQYGKCWSPKKDLFLYGGVYSAWGAKCSTPWPVDPANPAQLGSLYGDPYRINSNAYPGANGKIGVYANLKNFSMNTFYRNENTGLNSVYYNLAGAGDRTIWQTTSLGVRPKYIFELNDGDSIETYVSALWMQYGHIPDPGNPDTNRILSRESHYELKTIGKTTRFDKHSLAGGVLIGRRTFDQADTYFGSIKSNGGWEGGTTNWNEYGIFAEDIINVNEKWDVSAGIRYDKVAYCPIVTANNFLPPDTGNFSKRVATSYEFEGNNTLKFSYQEGFRYFDVAYMGWHATVNDELTAIGQSARLPDFVPETMASYELNYIKKYPEKKLKFDVNCFYNIYDKMLHWHSFSQSNSGGVDPLAVQAVINTYGWMGAHINAQDKFSTVGGDLSASWQPSESVSTMISYSYARPTSVTDEASKSMNLFSNDENSFSAAPTHMIKASVVSELIEEKLSAGFTYNFQSGMDVDNLAGFNVGQYGAIYKKDRHNVDVFTTYGVSKNLQAKVTVKNLLAGDVPPLTQSLVPYNGVIGYEKTYAYLSVQYTF